MADVNNGCKDALAALRVRLSNMLETLFLLHRIFNCFGNLKYSCCKNVYAFPILLTKNGVQLRGLT